MVHQIHREILQDHLPMTPENQSVEYCDHYITGSIVTRASLSSWPLGLLAEKKNQFWVSCFKFSFVPDIRAKLFWNHNPYLCYLVQGFSLCIIPKFLEIIYRELRVLNSLMNYASNTFVLIDFTIACFIFGIFQVRFYRFQIDFYFMALQLQMGSGNFTVLRFKLTLHYRFTTSVRFYRLYR